MKAEVLATVRCIWLFEDQKISLLVLLITGMKVYPSILPVCSAELSNPTR
jgi:hypothetical protein